MDWFQTGKEVWHGCILSLRLFNLYAQYIMWNAGMDEAQAGIKIARRNINNLRCADDTTSMADSETRKPLDKGEREWKNWLKTQHSENYNCGIWSHHFMASKGGGKCGRVTDLFSWAPESLRTVTVSMASPWKESHDKPRQCFKKQRHHFADNGPHGQSYCFSSNHVWIESWTVKKAKCWRIDAFKLWCWRRLLRAL